MSMHDYSFKMIKQYRQRNKLARNFKHSKKLNVLTFTDWGKKIYWHLKQSTIKE